MSLLWTLRVINFRNKRISTFSQNPIDLQLFVVRLVISQFLPQTVGIGSCSCNLYASFSVLYIISFARVNGKEFGNEWPTVMFFIVIFKKYKLK
jgi:hypothetical protein